MKKIVAIILAILAVLALVAGCSRPPVVSTEETEAPVAPASAPAPAPALTSTPAPFIFEISGSTDMDNEVVDSAVAESAKYVKKGTRHYIWSGTLEGESVNTISAEIEQGSGKLKETGYGTFTGTVNGKKGTFTFEDSANGYMLSFNSGIVAVSLNIVSGTGELKDLRGVISCIASFDASRCGGPYSGMLGFGMEPPASPAPPTTPAASTPAADTNTSGTFEETKEVYNSPAVTEKGIRNADLTTTFEFYGDLEGTLVNTGNSTINIITGKIKGENSTATFTGAVKGKKGTFTADGNYSGQMTSPTTAIVEITYIITGGTGELSDLRGTINLINIHEENHTGGSYTGMLSFGE